MWRVSDSLWGHRYAGAERLPRGVAGPSSAERPLAPTTKCTAGEAAHTLGQDLRPGVLPYLLSKPEAALSLSGHAQYPEYR